MTPTPPEAVRDNVGLAASLQQADGVGEAVVGACGHDAHTAMLLSALQVLSAHREEWTGQIGTALSPSSASRPWTQDRVFSSWPDSSGWAWR